MIMGHLLRFVPNNLCTSKTFEIWMKMYDFIKYAAQVRY